jgi:F-type H+-transporting ATPase subunit a
MFNTLINFAAADADKAADAAEGPHISLTQAPIFNIGGLEITNAMLFGWISVIFTIILLIYAANRMTVRPRGGIIQIVEVMSEFMQNTVEGAFNKQKEAKKHVPFFLTLFLLIIFANLLGLLPFTREAILVGEKDPLFKPLTASFNATLAAAVITMIYVYTSSVKALGAKGFLSHFFIGSWKNPLYLVIGVLEMISDLIRVVSLSLRLFLNVAIGEILIAVFAYLGGFLAPVTALPFFLMEIFVLSLQAYIFVILGTMYLAIAVNHGVDHASEEKEELTKNETRRRMQSEAAHEAA